MSHLIVIFSLSHLALLYLFTIQYLLYLANLWSEKSSHVTIFFYIYFLKVGEFGEYRYTGMNGILPEPSRENPIAPSPVDFN